MSGEDRMDAPNQQAVRPDGSHPSEEGSGGSSGEAEPKAEEQQAEDDGLDAMTKDELTALASERGVDVNSSMTKADIIAALRAA